MRSHVERTRSAPDTLTERRPNHARPVRGKAPQAPRTPRPARDAAPVVPPRAAGSRTRAPR